MLFDVVFRGGHVVDGTGAPAVAADVAVTGGRIAAVGRLGHVAAATIIDATGMIVAPGLIDAHAHSDWCPLLGDEHLTQKLASIRQGVTTEISGNCGLSPFPVLPATGGDATFPPGWSFPSMGTYRDAMASTPMVTNLAPLAGHAAIRRSVLGDAPRPATGEEIAAMARLLDAALEEGAFGVSTGLAVSPGAHAAQEELLTLGRVAGGVDRVYTTHMRQEGSGVVDSVAETIRLGEQAEVAVQISHHKVGGRPNWGLSNETLPLIERARDAGLDLFMDVYPWTATSNGLIDALPLWVTAGGPAAARTRLRESGVVTRLQQEMGSHSPYGDMLIAACPSRPDHEGRRVDEIAAAAGCSPIRLVADLVAEDPTVMVITFGLDDGEVRLLGSQPYALAGSDGLPYPGRQHPRVAGSFALLLGRAARGEGGATLPDTLHRMTGLTAARFGIPDRGVVERGRVADLFVFDPSTVDTRASYDEPWLAPVGVLHVLVAGRFVIRDGADTGTRTGAVLVAG